MAANGDFDDCTQGPNDLGPLELLQGTFAQPPGNFPVSFGWNLISLPQESDGSGSFRLLLNQYKEKLSFDVGLDACNRGQNGDQHIRGLQYSQTITQIASHDRRVNGDHDTDKRLKNETTIHQEAGQWLYMANDNLNHDLNIARMSSIPHGDTVLAFGRSKDVPDFTTKEIPDVDARPVVTILQKLHIPAAVSRAAENLKGDYLGPFNFFDEHGEFHDRFNFIPKDSSNLLRVWVEEFEKAGGKILKTTALPVSTHTKPGAVKNIPFVIKEANAAEVESTFWLHEVEFGGEKKVVLQYLQIVTLEFLAISWPHVSINTLVKEA